MSVILMKDNPTLPVAFPMQTKGDFYVFSQYWCHFQRRPISAIQFFQPDTLIPIIYLYSISVFKRSDVDKYASKLPMLVVSLEKTDINYPDTPEFIKAIPIPLILGMFTSEARINLGELPISEEDLLEQDAIDIFFEIIRNQLQIDENPILIGDVNNMYGKFGFPSKTEPKKSFLSKLFGF